MNQVKSFTVTGTTGTRNGRKETTLAAEVDKALQAVIDEHGDGLKDFKISPLGDALPNSVLVTVLVEAESKPKSKK